MREQLISKAEELFLRYGIRSVSMDDLARELGVSKKTIYQHVDNKSDLIRQIFITRSASESVKIEEMRKSAETAIEEMVIVARFMINQLREISPTSRYDLEKYYQDIHRELDELHTIFFMAFIKDNLMRGMNEGYYRNNIDVDVVAKFFVGMATKIGHNEYFPIKDYPIDYLVQQLFYYHIHGVASSKGIEEMKRYLGEEHEEQL